MVSIEFTIYFKIILFLSIILFVIGYLFESFLTPLIALSIFVFLMYSKLSFVDNLGEIKINRNIIEKQIFKNHPVNVKTKIINENGNVIISLKENIPKNSELIKGENKIQKQINKKQVLFLNYQIIFNSRGIQNFLSTDIEIFDICKLYKIKLKKDIKTKIWVHSDPNEIKKAKRVSQREHIELNTRSLTGLESMDDMEGIRNYQPGDRFKDIEWKSTSRLRKLMTKLYEKKELLDTIILIDCSYTMRRSKKKDSKIEHLIKLAVQLAKILQSIRHPIGLIAYDEHKIIKKINPTDNYNNIFQGLTELPNEIKTKEFITNKKIKELDFNINKEEKNKKFLSKIYPFLAKGKRKVKNQLQATGIYESMRYLSIDSKTKHIIIFTDLETNILSHYHSISLANKKKYNIWLLTPFSPLYNKDKKELTEENLEDIYKMYTKRDEIIKKLRNLKIDIISLTPSMEGVKIIEKIRKK